MPSFWASERSNSNWAALLALLPLRAIATLSSLGTLRLSIRRRAGIVPIPVEIVEAGAEGLRLRCPALAINGLIDEHRLLMAQQGGSQDRELLVGLQAAEAGLGFQHGGSSPSQSHPRISPTFDVAADLPEDSHHALDRVGAAERAPQLVGQTQADHGEHFVQPFVDRSRDARGIVIEPTRQAPENPLGLLGGRTVPGLTQHLLDPGVQRRVEPL